MHHVTERNDILAQSPIAGDHHAFALFGKPREGDAAPNGRRYAAPDITINQITWQTQSLTEPVHAVDYFAERGIHAAVIGTLDPSGEVAVSAGGRREVVIDLASEPVTGL